MRGPIRLSASLVMAGLAAAAPLAAHTFAPSLLELRQEAGGVTVRFKQPEVRVAGSRLRPILPAGCRPLGVPENHKDGTGVVTTWRADCGDLVGEEIAVEGIAGSRADILLRLELADGRLLRHVLTADRPSFIVPREAGFFDVAVLYGRLGVEHILSGFDHLLFVLGLVLLVRGRRRLVATVTAFTAGHSVTLALAALGVVHVPQGPTEAAIALSIYVLAVELTRPQGTASWLRRSPWSVATLFGLLHGLGFAGALSEVGLPEREIPAALFSFNAGIEIGQLAFVAVVLTAARLLAAGRTLAAGHVHAPLLRRWTAPFTRSPAYAMGSLAAFWFFERLAGVL